MKTKFSAALLLLAILGSLALAQRWRNWTPDPDVRPDRNGVPDWEVNKHMPNDVFTYVRLKYDSWSKPGSWLTDYPDCDINFSYRLQELTSMEVHPDGLILEIEDERLFDYPWCYMSEPGGLNLSDAEAATLRKYLLNGGFLMVDDFWGDWEWAGFMEAFEKVFPDRKWTELPIEHPIFNCVFTLKEKPQIPALGTAIQGREQGITWEWHKPNAETPHYRAYFDDDGRMCAIICHNTDLGDGWEREGEDEWYFREFAEKKAYPLGINIIFYALTH